jgi:hypothetical protein
VDTVSSNGTAHNAEAPKKRGPGRPRKDGSAPQPRTTTSSTPRKKAAQETGVRKYLNSDILREFLLLPDEVQTSIRNLVRYEDTTSVEFDLG